MAKKMTSAFAAAAGLVVVLLLVASPLFLWFCCRIEPRNGEVAVLIRKTGLELPEGEIIAPDARYKGIQLEVLGEGRYFRNPYTWTWEIVKITDIPAGKFGVLVRKFGKDLPEGEIIAPGPEYKGIVREVLGTGKMPISLEEELHPTRIVIRARASAEIALPDPYGKGQNL